ncbi:MAG TPA: hypothetical protein VK797_16495 [Tepidisphaeraceae bacterium]|nr:hypothetical protein [Tepidisphaeraceae bacterium]
MQIDLRAKFERPGAEDALGNDQPAAARALHGSDRSLERIRVHRASIAHGAEIRDCEIAIGNRWSRGPEMLESVDVCGADRRAERAANGRENCRRQRRQLEASLFASARS